MLDTNVKEVLDLSDIKGVMVEVMLNKYTEREVSKTTLNKFAKYMAKQQQRNGSKNSIDNRVKSLYNAIKKEYDNFVELNSIMSELD